MTGADRDEKQDAMARAEKHANPHWWRCMLECGRLVAERNQYFYTDDIVQLCRKRYPDASTHELRAIGPLMRQLARLGYCEGTEDWVPSTQAQNHKRPMRMWQSLIYRVAA